MCNSGNVFKKRRYTSDITAKLHTKIYSLYYIPPFRLFSPGCITCAAVAFEYELPELIWSFGLNQAVSHELGTIQESNSGKEMMQTIFACNWGVLLPPSA